MKYVFIICIFIVYSCKTSKISDSVGSIASLDSIRQIKELDFQYSLTEASKQKVLGNYSLAINHLYRCLELKPGNAAACYQLSEIFSLKDDMSRSIYFARKSVRLEPQNIWYNLLLAKLYKGTNNLDSAVLVYKAIIKLNPDNPEHQFNLVQLYLKQEEIRKAEKLLRKMQNKFGLTEEIAFTLFQIYKIKTREEKCFEVLNIALKSFPEETRFYGLMAEEYISVGKYDSALVYYNKLFAIDPNNDKGLFSLIEYYRITEDYNKVLYYSRVFISNPDYLVSDKIEILLNLVSNNNLYKSYRDSVEFLIRFSIKLYPQEIRFRTVAADYYVKSNKYAEAKQELILLAQNYPANYFICEQLLYVLNNLSDYLEIYRYSKEFLVKFKDKPFLYLMHGISSFQLKKYEEAVSSLTSGLFYVRNNKELSIQFYSYLAEIYNRLGNNSKSDGFFDALLHLDPNNTNALNNYSYYLSLRGEKLDLALRNIKKCLDAEPNSPYYLDTYAWVLFVSGNLPESKLQIERAMELGGNDNPDILEHYVQILYKLGDKEKALYFYKILKSKGNPGSQTKLLFENE